MAASVLCCKTQDNTIGKDRPLKTATYLRVSTNDQDLEAQRQLLDRFGGDCRDPQLNLVAKYFDFGKSGDSFNSRPGLQQLLRMPKLACSKRSWSGSFPDYLAATLSKPLHKSSAHCAMPVSKSLIRCMAI